jgi:hypothetical protein
MFSPSTKLALESFCARPAQTSARIVAEKQFHSRRRFPGSNLKDFHLLALRRPAFSQNHPNRSATTLRMP